ncbi:putative transport protein MmpL12, partial [Mycobacterium marinum]
STAPTAPPTDPPAATLTMLTKATRYRFSGRPISVTC